MSQIVISADTATIVLNGRIITDIAAGDYVTLTPSNPLTSRANSANNGVTISGRVDAGVHVMVIRVQKFSNDDIWLNQQRTAAIPVVFNGSVKESLRARRRGTEGNLRSSGRFYHHTTDANQKQPGR